MNIFKFFKTKKNPAQNQPDKLREFFFTELVDENGINFSDSVKTQHTNYLKDCVTQGKLSGLDNTPNTDSKTPHGFEMVIQTFYQALIHAISKICTETVSKLGMSIAKLRSELEDFKTHTSDFIEKESEKIRLAKEIAVKKVKAIFSQKHTSLKEKLTEVVSLISNLKQTLREIEAELEQDHEAKPLRFRRKLLYVVLGLIAVLEFPMSFKTLLLWRDDIISTLLLTVLFSLIIPFAAHSFGSYLKKKEISRKEIFWMVVAVVSALAISGVIGHVRYQYLDERDIHILSSWGFGAINFILFLMGSFISYHLSYKNPEQVKALFDYQDELKEKENLREELHEQLHNLETEEAGEYQNIAEKYSDDAEARANATLTTLKNQLLAEEKEYQAVLSIAQNQENIICAYYDEAISVFRGSNEKWRNTPNPEYWANPKPTLTTFFSGKTPKDSFTNPKDTGIPVEV